MAVDNEREGWWLASDGDLYPPHLHPAVSSTAQTPGPHHADTESASRQLIARNSVFKRLPYGGQCITCGAHIPKGGSGWHDATISKVACSNCPPWTPTAEDAKSPRGSMQANPAGGTSALAISISRRDPKWTKGAAGEYLMAKALHDGLPAGIIVLNDRAVPRSHANLDHVVIAPSGVWIIDSKHWKGLIQVKSVGFLNPVQKLLVGGRDETSRTEKIYSQVIPIANVLGDPSIPIHPALVFVGGNWGAGAMLRLVQDRPYEMLGVLISWPKAVISKVAQPGPLAPEAVADIGAMLDRALPPATEPNARYLNPRS